jgi:hypothetical protein
LGDVASAVAAAFWQDASRDLTRTAHLLADPQAPENVRLQWLQALLAQHELLLVFDNFEDVLTLAGREFRDQTSRAVFGELLGAAQRGKLLVTSRYPLPGAEAALARLELGPLSPAETRKLMLRHEGLKRCPPQSTRLIQRAIGGHPGRSSTSMRCCARGLLASSACRTAERVRTQGWSSPGQCGGTRRAAGRCHSLGGG